jgi:hypothetical protein
MASATCLRGAKGHSPLKCHRSQARGIARRPIDPDLRRGERRERGEPPRVARRWGKERQASSGVIRHCSMTSQHPDGICSVSEAFWNGSRLLHGALRIVHRHQGPRLKGSAGGAVAKTDGGCMAASTTGIGHLRRAPALAALAVACAAVGLRAQGHVAPTSSPIAIPLPEGAVERPDLEQQATVSGVEGRSVLVYRWDAPIEPIVRYYIQHLGGDRDGELDTASVRPGGTSGISYHLAFYDLADQCADSAAGAAGAAGGPCKHWKRATDLRRTLNNGRLGIAPGVWVQRLTFRWFSRDDRGVLTQWTTELFDSGVTDDWKHYVPATDLTIVSQEMSGRRTVATVGTP